MRKFSTVLFGAAASAALLAGPASAAVTFDAATGTGFVGKGDVQTALTLNNKQLNDQATSLKFTYSGTTEQTTTWDCLNERNENVQERERTTTTDTTGVVAHVARDNKKQITGFNLMGFDGSTSTVVSADGNKLNTCPNANSTYVLGSTVVGEPTVVSGGLYVNGMQIS